MAAVVIAWILLVPLALGLASSCILALIFNRVSGRCLGPGVAVLGRCYSWGWECRGDPEAQPHAPQATCAQGTEAVTAAARGARGHQPRM